MGVELEESAGFDWRERHWGWLVLGLGVLFWGVTAWPFSAACAVWAAIFFLAIRPMRCGDFPDGAGELCLDWARGLLRACPGKNYDEHQERRWDAVRDLFTKHTWPPMWRNRSAVDALVGTAASLVLFAASGLGYVLTKTF